MKEALYYKAETKDSQVRCQLCPHNCLISLEQTGLCRQRKNIKSKLHSLNYGRATSVHIDPIEKKPLYHFAPASQVLSLGTNGCNLACLFCQNWSISQEDAPTESLTPEAAVALAKKHHSAHISYTYNEPLIWYEFVLASSRLAHEQGIGNILVTNGFINPEPLQKLLPYIDALNIDIKSIEPSFYRKLCRAKLEPVLETAKIARSKALVEITNLVIPDENDTEDHFTRLSQWVAQHLGKDTPLHFSAYYPAHKLNRPPTPVNTLLKAYDIARQHLHFVYLGNVATSAGNDTACHHCGTRLIQRLGYQTKILKLKSDGKCGQCGADNNIILR